MDYRGSKIINQAHTVKAKRIKPRELMVTRSSAFKVFP
jgi:hypothetical protein